MPLLFLQHPSTPPRVPTSVRDAFESAPIRRVSCRFPSSLIPVTASEQTTAAWYCALAVGGNDPQRVGAAMGAIAREHPEPVPIAQRRRMVEARLVTAEWPLTLQVTAIDAETGQLHVFDRTSGIALTDAVMAGGAVPGVWPLVSINGRAWIDGGRVSPTNARLAKGYERVMILAPMPTGYGSIPGGAEDAAAMEGVQTRDK